MKKFILQEVESCNKCKFLEIKLSTYDHYCAKTGKKIEISGIDMIPLSCPLEDVSLRPNSKTSEPPLQIQLLINKYNEEIKKIINPDNLMWEHFILERDVELPNIYDTVEEYLELEGHLSEHQFNLVLKIRTFIAELESLK